MVPRLSSRPTLTMERQGSRPTTNREPRHHSRTPWTSWMKRVTLPSSARPSTSKRYTSTTALECRVGPSTSETWSSASSRAARTTTSSLHYGRDHTSSRKCSGQAPTSSRPSTVRSLPMPRTSSNYIAFTLNKHTPSLISFAIKLLDL